VDLSEALLEFGQAEVVRAGLQLDGALRPDARELRALRSRTCDAALLMGPMYHVVEATDRRRVLGELRRILKSEGVAIITYLNSWGLLKTGISDFPDRFRDMQFLRSMIGDQTFRGKALHNFTECYWSTPPAAIAEVQQAGFAVVTYASGEGFAGGLRPLIESLAVERPDVYANVVNMAVETSQLPRYRDTGEHIQIVVRNRRSVHEALGG
jgi:S-adenosylmethionine-dependent methyltransferase